MANFDPKLILECDADIRAGLSSAVKDRLSAINSAQVPREFRLPLANLCRRVAMNEMAMRLLAPVINEAREGLGEPASQGELAEYAVLLQRFGVIDESMKILKGISHLDVPETLLYQAFCHFNRWEYFESVPLLQSYVQRQVDPYKKLIGEVNLAAALTTTMAFAEARPLLGKIIDQCAREGHRRLQANAFEIRSQIELSEHHFDAAEADLKSAHATLSGDGTVAELSTLKWRAVLQAFRTQNVDALREFRGRAVEFGDWEAVRHSDLNLLRFEFSEELFNYHLFGSPWQGYREIAQRNLGRVISVDHFDFGNAGGKTVDVAQAKLDGKEAFPAGSKLHRALATLAADFYRPVPVGVMFNALFPNEFYDVFSSPNRVHQVLHRLRKWAADQGLGFEIDHGKDGYQLRMIEPLILRVPYEKKDPDSNKEMLRSLHRGSLRGELFSAQECAADLKISLPSARKFLAWAIESGGIEKIGAGSGTRYQLKSNLAKVG